MNNILTNSISDPNKEQPFLGPSLNFLQGANKDMINAIMLNLIGPSYSASTVYILSGCVNSSILPTYNISAGYVFFNGEVYRCPAVSGTVSGGNTLYSAADLSYATLATPDPVTGVTPDPSEFSDGSLINVHQVRNWKIQQLTTGTGANAFSTFVNVKQTANPVFAKLSSVGSGAASTSFTFTGWDASPIDADGIFNISNGRVTPKVGYYKFSFCVTATPSTSPSGTVDLNIYKNGVLLDAVISETFTGNNNVRGFQFNNYIIHQTVGTDYYTFVITTPSGTYTYSSVQLTVEAVNNLLI